jgi:hypothetical protein
LCWLLQLLLTGLLAAWLLMCRMPCAGKVSKLSLRMMFQHYKRPNSKL